MANTEGVVGSALDLILTGLGITGGGGLFLYYKSVIDSKRQNKVDLALEGKELREGLYDHIQSQDEKIRLLERRNDAVISRYYDMRVQRDMSRNEVNQCRAAAGQDLKVWEPDLPLFEPTGGGTPS